AGVHGHRDGGETICERHDVIEIPPAAGHHQGQGHVDFWLICALVTMHHCVCSVLECWQERFLMAVTIQLPSDVEERLRAQSPNLDAEIRDVVALELFRRGKLSHFELSNVLGLDRFQTDAYLKRHNV